MTQTQYHGKRSSVMVPVPAGVKKWAKKAFEMKKAGFKGATETGWKRAKQLATKDEISIEDLRYMRNWYARHKYTSYPGFKSWKDAGKPMDEKKWHNKRSIVAWVTWGADPGLKWVNSKTTLLNKVFNKNYEKI